VLIALTNSPWALADGVLVRDCAGIGPHKGDAAFQQTYAQFRCRSSQTPTAHHAARSWSSRRDQRQCASSGL
jgi:hypothetical protein